MWSVWALKTSNTIGQENSISENILSSSSPALLAKSIFSGSSNIPGIFLSLSGLTNEKVDPSSNFWNHVFVSSLTGDSCLTLTSQCLPSSSDWPVIEQILHRQWYGVASFLVLVAAFCRIGIVGVFSGGQRTKGWEPFEKSTIVPALGLVYFFSQMLPIIGIPFFGSLPSWGVNNRTNLGKAPGSSSNVVRTEYFEDLFSENHFSQSENDCSVGVTAINPDWPY